MLQLSGVGGVTIYGPEPGRGRAALCAFNVEGVHPNDLSMIMDQEGAAWLANIAQHPAVVQYPCLAGQHGSTSGCGAASMP